MSNKKMQRNKALSSSKKIWLIQVYLKDATKSQMDTLKEGKWILVYVVDDSMGRAIKKAVHYYGRKTGIKSLKKRNIFDKNSIGITVRRATKMEIVNVRAGMGFKGGVLPHGLEVI